MKPLNDWEGIDPETMARAKVLGQIAIERGSSPPPEGAQLRQLEHTEPVRSKRTCRLFACRDE